MATWYRVGPYSDKVEPVEVEKETAGFVVVGGRRNAKRSEYESYFPGEAEAGSFLIRRRQNALKDAQLKAQQARSALGELRKRYPDAPEWNT